MKIPSHQSERAGRADATMTPMIDVVFLLLIFFVCTASFQVIEQDLPSSLRIASGAGDSDIQVEPEFEDLEDVIVKIFWRDDTPSWEVNGEPKPTLASVEGVLTAIASVDSGLPVILDVASEVPLGHVIAVYDVSRGVGFSKINFAAAIDG